MTSPCRSRVPGNGSLADPEDAFGAARVCLLRVDTPMLQPGTMKRAGAVLTANHESRPEKSGRMKFQEFSSPLTLRPLTTVAIDAFGGARRTQSYCLRLSMDIE